MSDAAASMLLSALVFAVPTGLVIWGWSRFASRPRVRGAAATASLWALALVSVSLLFAFGASIVSYFSSGWPFENQAFLGLFFYGGLLCLVALPCAAVGAFGKSPTRWLSLLAAVLMSLFWLGSAMSS